MEQENVIAFGYWRCSQNLFILDFEQGTQTQFFIGWQLIFAVHYFIL